MKNKIYEAPKISEELIEIADVIAMSNQNVLGEIFDDDGERFGG